MADPLLEAIDGPEVLRTFDDEELRALAQEIRDVMIDAVSVHGGHLGSNLGAVELTLALHRVFESPRDAIVWDTGHQTYVHKLVVSTASPAYGRAAGCRGTRHAPSRSTTSSRTAMRPPR
jgi:1-deoxy-D-xylulose-5-phosphate synthase